MAPCRQPHTATGTQYRTTFTASSDSLLPMRRSSPPSSFHNSTIFINASLQGVLCHCQPASVSWVPLVTELCCPVLVRRTRPRRRELGVCVCECVGAHKDVWGNQRVDAVHRGSLRLGVMDSVSDTSRRLSLLSLSRAYTPMRICLPRRRLSFMPCFVLAYQHEQDSPYSNKVTKEDGTRQGVENN